MITSIPNHISSRAGRKAACDCVANAAIAQLTRVTGIRRVTRCGASRFLPEFTYIDLLVLVSNTDCVQEFDDMIQMRLETCDPAEYFESFGTCKTWRTGDLTFVVTCDDSLFSRALAETERLAVVQSALASQRIEGLEPDAQAVADAERWARGEMTIGAAVDQYKARMRLEAGTPQPLPDLAYRSFGNTN